MLTIIKIFLKFAFIFVPKFASKLAFKLFFMPSKRAKIQEEEKGLFSEAKKTQVMINGKDTIFYEWGEGEKIALFVHGWESRASHFSKFIKAYLDNGYKVLAFDAPGHGWSKGNNTNIFEYRESIEHLQNKGFKFDAIISHSFGSVCAGWAIKKGVDCKKFIVISGLCNFEHLIDEFSSILSLSERSKKSVVTKVNDMCLPLTDIWNKLSLDNAPESLKSDVLVIHDKVDSKLSWSNGEKIASAYLTDLITTKNLGHMKILKDDAVIQTVLDFSNLTSLKEINEDG
jgi:pimeloyl-ACP methyl ester carboxylesterase